MIIFYLVLVVLFFIGTKIYVNCFNENYLAKKQTTIINGLFVITIFFSHMSSNIDNVSMYDVLNRKLMQNIGQLMVTTFFVFSGYGILESITKKKDYIKSFPKRRLFPLWFNMALSTLAFFMMKLLIGENITWLDIIQALSGYSSWFILITLLIYFLILFVFSERIIKNVSIKTRVFILIILLLIAVGILENVLPNYYVNTMLCFPFGMLISLYKEKIELFVKKRYWIFFIFSIFIFMLMFYLMKRFNINNNFYYNAYAIVFSIVILLISMKVSFSNKVFEFFGKNVFWIYMLQRIPRIMLAERIDNSIIYSFFVLLITIMMSYVMNKISIFLLKKIGVHD